MSNTQIFQKIATKLTQLAEKHDVRGTMSIATGKDQPDNIQLVISEDPSDEFGNELLVLCQVFKLEFRSVEDPSGSQTVIIASAEVLNELMDVELQSKDESEAQ